MIASMSFKRAVLVVGSVVNDTKGMISCLSASITDVMRKLTSKSILAASTSNRAPRWIEDQTHTSPESIAELDRAAERTGILSPNGPGLISGSEGEETTPLARSVKVAREA
jgi:hypothetical protein